MNTIILNIFLFIYLLFKEWSAGLPTQDIFKDIIRMEPTTPVYTYKGKQQKFVEYYKTLIPSNFVALGDSFVCFNPSKIHFILFIFLLCC